MVHLYRKKNLTKQGGGHLNGISQCGRFKYILLLNFLHI